MADTTKHTLNRTYLVSGRHVGPGEVDLSEDEVSHLRSVGALEAEAEAERFSDFPLLSHEPGTIVAQQGVTPGDPVQRASSPTPAAIVSGPIELQTQDPAAGMPPPVVHTSEGEAVEPKAAEDDDDGEDDTSDSGSETEDDGSEDGKSETEADSGSQSGSDGEGDTPPAEAVPAPAPRRGGRVTAQPRPSAE